MNWPSFGPPGPNWEVAEAWGRCRWRETPARRALTADQDGRRVPLDDADALDSLYRTPTWTSQKARKNPNWGPVIPAEERMGAATMGPASASYSVAGGPTDPGLDPKPYAGHEAAKDSHSRPAAEAALVRTGKGTPYLVPLCAFRIIGTRTIALLTKTVMIPCHQDIRSSTRLPARYTPGRRSPIQSKELRRPTRRRFAWTPPWA